MVSFPAPTDRRYPSPSPPPSFRRTGSSVKHSPFPPCACAFLLQHFEPRSRFSLCSDSDHELPPLEIALLIFHLHRRGYFFFRSAAHWLDRGPPTLIFCMPRFMGLQFPLLHPVRRLFGRLILSVLPHSMIRPSSPLCAVFDHRVFPCCSEENETRYSMMAGFFMLYNF